MRIRSVALLVTVGAAVFSLAGCSSAEVPAAPTEVPQPSNSPSETDTAVLESLWHTAEATDAPGPKLALYADGTFAAHDGCNPFNGTYEQDGDDLTFEVKFGTKKGCVGVDTWLSHIATATVDADVLQVYDAQQSSIGSLPRQKEQ
ncbi:META domain-containing protein [Microbacterium sp. YY-01]|uniref:META domain-containing protein n=1 Tax=Microbacterium sp. YY-01 TaxID=3421634 RepID=UPI003D165BFC